MSRAVVAIMMALATFVATATVATAARPHAAPLGTPPDEGYLFVYFTGEGTANGGRTYVAAGRGNDPLTFDELNDGRPVLTSPLGERGVRGPFIIRSPDGGKFYLLADLEIFDNDDWVEAQRHGSRSIMVWESRDLVNWSAQRSVQVSPPTAGNTWAPEASWDAGNVTAIRSAELPELKAPAVIDPAGGRSRQVG